MKLRAGAELSASGARSVVTGHDDVVAGFESQAAAAVGDVDSGDGEIGGVFGVDAAGSVEDAGGGSGEIDVLDQGGVDAVQSQGDGVVGVMPLVGSMTMKWEEAAGTVSERVRP